MRLLAAIWENIYDLFVEDGSIALGTVIALVAVGIWSTLTAAHSDAREWGGLLLFVLLMGLLVGNLYRTGRAAAARRAGG
jgi:hypothetical protein